MMAEPTGLFKSIYLLTPRQGLPDYLLSVAAQCLYFLNLGGTGSQIQVTKILGVYGVMGGECIFIHIFIDHCLV